MENWRKSLFLAVQIVVLCNNLVLSEFTLKSLHQTGKPCACPSIIQSEQSELNIVPKHDDDTPFEKATFGMGCFWQADSLYGATPGILRTRVGYSGGEKENPKYRDLGNYTEVIEIDYDPNRISYNEVLRLFWNHHANSLTTKTKRQYTSLIMYHNEQQKAIAEASRAEEQIKREPEIIITEIVPVSKFYPAEDHHQKHRLQGHEELANSLAMNSTLLQTSYVAAKLNGYLVGVGGLSQYLQEADSLGLTPSQKEYVRYFVEKNEGGGPVKNCCD